MELYIDRDALSRELARIQGVIERRSTQPILANALLHARDGKLRVTATDTEVAYSGELDANVAKPGELSVDASALWQVVRAMPDPTLFLQAGDGHRLTVKSGRASFELNGIAAEEYPAVPLFEAEATAQISERGLKRLIERTSFAVAAEDVRWGLNGAHLEEREVEGERRLRMVATDGHRLALAEVAFEGSFAFAPRMLVPRKALAVLRKLLEERDEAVSVDFGDGALQLRRPGQTFWFRLLDGEFPDYRAVIPTSHKHAATVRASELGACLRRAQIVVADRTRPVTFRFDAGEAEVEVHNVDRGSVREAIAVELDGAPITVGFNVRYLLDVLSAVSADRLVMELAHPLAPCLVRDPDDDTAMFVVMPMRLD